MLRNAPHRDGLRLIQPVTDNERVLGLPGRPRGAGGMGIPVGKTRPLHGRRRDPPLALPADLTRRGDRRRRAPGRSLLPRLSPAPVAGREVRGVHRGVRRRRQATSSRTPCCNGKTSTRNTALLLLDRYRKRFPNFNDDIQGPRRRSRSPASSPPCGSPGMHSRSQRIVCLGAGGGRRGRSPGWCRCGGWPGPGPTPSRPGGPRRCSIPRAWYFGNV